MFTSTKSAVLLVFVAALSGLASLPAAQQPDDARPAEVLKKNDDLSQPAIKVRGNPADAISRDIKFIKQKLQLPFEQEPGDAGKKPEPKKTESAEKQAADEQILKNAGLKCEPDDLLEFFRKRTPKDADRAAIEAAIRRLGSGAYREREEAMKLLIGKGPQALELLRQAIHDSDPEISGRAERCSNRIRDEEVAVEITAAAVRLLGQRKPAGGAELLFAYVPVAHMLGLDDDVRDALCALASQDGKVDSVLVKGLHDASAFRRAAAAEVLTRAGAREHRDAVLKLLQDRDLQVRLRVSRGLALAKDAAGIPPLIDLLPQLSFNQATQVDELLFRIAEGKSPPMVSVGRDDSTRRKSQAAWHAWWQKEGKNADFSRLADAPQISHTMVVLLDERRVIDLDKDNVQLWSVEDLDLPLDAQILPGDRLLVAEYNAARVTERNLKGEILWEKKFGAPLVAQRLPNGHTFLANDSQLAEYDREDKEIMSIRLESGERIMKALKLPNNDICCLTGPGDAFNQFGQASPCRVIRLDSTGKELNSIDVDLSNRTYGGRIHMLPSGNVLVPHNGEGRVVEYNPQGRVVWQVAVSQPIAAFRLANGNTLITSMDIRRGAVEFTPAGAEVWTFRAATRVTRAMRR